MSCSWKRRCPWLAHHAAPGPEAEPKRSPENNLHKRVTFDFIKNDIISASPDSPAHGSHPHPDQASNPFMLITKPCTKHVVDRSWLR
jgi:hypothetical protein